MCYGIFNRLEILLIEIKDVSVKEEGINVEFLHETKRRVKGFRFKSPAWLEPYFKWNVSQLKHDLPNTTRFMRNYHNKRNLRSPNMDKKSSWAIELEDRLRKDEDKSFRHSTATQLVESGMSIAGLF